MKYHDAAVCCGLQCTIFQIDKAKEKIGNRGSCRKDRKGKPTGGGLSEVQDLR